MTDTKQGDRCQDIKKGDVFTHFVTRAQWECVARTDSAVTVLSYLTGDLEQIDLRRNPWPFSQSKNWIQGRIAQ